MRQPISGSLALARVLSSAPQSASPTYAIARVIQPE
jgi:hypothetical protein